METTLEELKRMFVKKWWGLRNQNLVPDMRTDINVPNELEADLNVIIEKAKEGQTNTGTRPDPQNVNPYDSRSRKRIGK
jgi:hypothetical protein